LECSGGDKERVLFKEGSCEKGNEKGKKKEKKGENTKLGMK